jgi:hypothetical protein
LSETKPVPKDSGLLKPPALYELVGSYAHLSALCSVMSDPGAPDEDYSAELQEALGAIKDAIEVKAVNISRVVLQAEAEADWVDARAKLHQEEADRLYYRSRRTQAKADSLRSYLAANLATLGEDTIRFKDAIVSVTLSKRGRDVPVVVDEEKVPTSYKRAHMTIRLSSVPVDLLKFVRAVDVAKSDINDDFEKNGTLPPGIGVEPAKRRLTIR